MLVVYASKTSNVKRFINKLSFPTKSLEKGLEIDEPFVLVTYTTGFGQVPEDVIEFLNSGINRNNMLAVSASGNKNWGDLFAKSADTISNQFNVPIISKFELSGTDSEVAEFTQGVLSLEIH